MYDKYVKLSRVNTLLLVAIILINGYIIGLPFASNLLFWFQKSHTQQTQKLTQTIHTPLAKAPVPTTATPDGNRLIIPAMLLDQVVHEGKTIATLRQGLWRLPYTSTPDQGGNTVFVGHRFTYTNPRGTLYYLDKVHVGDEIGVTWNGKKYLYKVSEVTQVEPSDLAVEAQTADPEITIYTCTPLWLPKNRLVVVAKPETGTLR
jgi:LPXTG-site transpeptidase (sortase) family protein